MNQVKLRLGMIRNEILVQAPSSVVEEAKRLRWSGFPLQALLLLEANSLTYEIHGDRMEVRCTNSRRSQAAMLKRKKEAA